MERIISATEAQASFDEVLELVAASDETILVEQDGLPRVFSYVSFSYKVCGRLLALTASFVFGIIRPNRIPTTAIETSRPTPRCPASLNPV